MTRNVLQLPPMDSFNKCVSLLFRYGMCDRPLVLSAWMQFPRALNDWLMLFASSNVAPLAPDRPTRSLPARSTRFRNATFQSASEMSAFLMRCHPIRSSSSAANSSRRFYEDRHTEACVRHATAAGCHPPCAPAAQLHWHATPHPCERWCASGCCLH